MASSETSFDSYTFTYKWTVKDLGTRLCNPSELKSPEFNSPPGTNPLTKWELVIEKEGYARIYNEAPQRRQTAVRSASAQRHTGHVVDLNSDDIPEEYASVRLQRLADSVSYPPDNGRRSTRPALAVDSITGYVLQAKDRPHTKIEQVEQVWVEARLKIPPIVTGELRERPTCIAKTKHTISFSRCLLLSKLRDSDDVTFECKIKVWQLDKPVHKQQESLLQANKSISFPEFNLSKLLLEDRQNNFFTDVTIVAADKKEFRAHKVVLAYQSKFFKTRFSGRWAAAQNTGQGGDRVEMTDISATVMEAMFSYMYTGEVADIENIAMDVLPVAEEYGLEGLRKVCEQALAKSLNHENAVDILVHANSYNAQDLKKVCMDYICLNIVPIRKSEGWKKLKETETCRDLCTELLDKITEKLW